MQVVKKDKLIDTQKRKPFYKSNAFIICLTISIVFILLAIGITIVLGLIWNDYRGAIKAFNDAYQTAVTSGQPTFTVTYNGKELLNWVNGVSSNTFNTKDYLGKIEDADLEVWMYMTRPLSVLSNLHNTNLSFLYNFNGHNINTNVALYWSSAICWITTFMFIVSIIVMGISYARKKKLVEDSKINLGVEEYFEAESQEDHKIIEQAIQQELSK